MAETAMAVEERRKVSAQFKMPKVSVGDIVYWFPPGRHTPAPMTVVRVGDRSIEGHADIPNNNWKVCKVNIRHKSDPELSVYDAENEGTWDYSDFAKRVMAIEAAMKLVEKNVTFDCSDFVKRVEALEETVQFLDK